MKTILLSISLLISVFSQAQNWCPSGAQWIYSTGSVIENGTANVFYQKDTFINGINCKKLEVREDIFAYRTYNEYTYAQGDTVFFLYDSIFWPTYFFNAAIGDTIVHRNTYPTADCDTFWNFVVDSTATVVINGDSLRYYRMNRVDNTLVHPQRLEVMEKFGVLKGFLKPWTSCLFYEEVTIYGVNCYQDDSFGSYDRIPHIPCKIITGIDGIEDKLNFLVYPNPATNQLNISIDGHTITKYQVMDYPGKVVIDNQLNSSDLSIDVSSLAQGVYLIKLELNNGQFVMRKFIRG